MRHPCYWLFGALSVPPMCCPSRSCISRRFSDKPPLPPRATKLSSQRDRGVSSLFRADHGDGILG